MRSIQAIRYEAASNGPMGVTIVLSDHPYEAPKVPTVLAGRGNAKGRSPLRLPAIALIVLSAFELASVTVSIVFLALIVLRMIEEDAADVAWAGLRVDLIRSVVLVVVQAIVLYGSVQMIRGGSYHYAMAAAVISIVPLISPCVFLGIPFGIWALVLLLRQDVRARFRRAVGGGGFS